MDSISSLGAAAGSSATTQSAAQASRDKLGADYQSFLKLLIAQVSNQDPLEPMDSTAFVSQLAQLTQVEQSISTNETLEKIETRLGASEGLSDVVLIGREVTVPTNRIELSGGRAPFSYDLAKPAESVKAVIRANDGTLLREIPGLLGPAGEQQDVVWDGKDMHGLQVPDNTFRVEIDAKDANGKQVSYTTYAASKVEQVAFRGGQPMLVLSNEDEAPAGSVIRVR